MQSTYERAKKWMIDDWVRAEMYSHHFIKELLNMCIRMFIRYVALNKGINGRERRESSLYTSVLLKGNIQFGISLSSRGD